jgi:hypothetical protein
MWDLISRDKELSLAIAFVLGFTGSWRSSVLLTRYRDLLGATPDSRYYRIVHLYQALRRSCLPIAAFLLACHLKSWKLPTWLFAIAMIYWCNVFRTISAALSEADSWSKQLKDRGIHIDEAESL